MMTSTRMTRRQFFETLGKGSLVVGFSLSPRPLPSWRERRTRQAWTAQFTVLSGILSGPPPSKMTHGS